MNKTLKMVNAALFAALCCVSTMCIHIPTPGTSGYIHPGDALVILSGIILGPVYGFLAAGIGSALADMLFGYYVYVPATFLIKGVMALTCAMLFKMMTNNNRTNHTISVVICSTLAAVIMVCGYLGYELILYGAGAIASVPANMIQGIAGIVLATLFYPVFSRVLKQQNVADI